MKQYVYLFVAVCLGSAEAQSCMFPCDWRGKTFLSYQIVSSVPTQTGDNWSFTSDGRSSFLTSYGTLECFQINGQFLILRNPNDGSCFCSSIRVFDANSFISVPGRGSTSCDACALCSGTGVQTLWTAFGATAPVAPPPDCTIPAECLHPNSCVNNGNLVIGNCDSPPTTSTTTLSTTTLKRQCHSHSSDES